MHRNYNNSIIWWGKLGKWFGHCCTHTYIYSMREEERERQVERERERVHLHESVSNVFVDIYEVFIEQHCPQLKYCMCCWCCRFSAVHAAKDERDQPEISICALGRWRILLLQECASNHLQLWMFRGHNTGLTIMNKYHMLWLNKPIWESSYYCGILCFVTQNVD